MVDNNKELSLLDVAAVTVKRLNVYDNGRETTAVFPRLATVLGGESWEQSTGFSNLISLGLPQLREVHGQELYFSNNILPELHLPRLESVNATLTVHNNSVLTDLTLPRLSDVRRLSVKYNPRLLNLTANVLARAGAVDLAGNFTNVELFSLVDVAGDFRLVGAPSMDCSWFDDHFFQKIVKGSYQCTGNHTRPDVPRRPSTATDVAQLPRDVDAGGSGGLGTAAKAGIGVGATLGGIALLSAGAFLVWARARPLETASQGHEAPTHKGELDGEMTGGVAGGAGGVPTDLDVPDDEKPSPGLASAAAELEVQHRDAAAARELAGAPARAELPAGGAATAELPA